MRHKVPQALTVQLGLTGDHGTQLTSESQSSAWRETERASITQIYCKTTSNKYNYKNQKASDGFHSSEHPPPLGPSRCPGQPPSAASPPRSPPGQKRRLGTASTGGLNNSRGLPAERGREEPPRPNLRGERAARSAEGRRGAAPSPLRSSPHLSRRPWPPLALPGHGTGRHERAAPPP